MSSEELIQSVLEDVNSFNIDDIPTIDLYMDQVTTYLNNKFDSSKRYEDDKLLTKTMINNYAKSRLLPPPEKKKYSKDHIIVLAMIFFFKNVISINDITTILKPLLDKYFHNDEQPLEDLVNGFLVRAKSCDMSHPILKELENSMKSYTNSESEDKDYMMSLELISLLSYDVFVRKMIIEKLIDSLTQTSASPTKDTHDKKEKNKSDEKKDIKKETD